MKAGTTSSSKSRKTAVLREFGLPVLPAVAGTTGESLVLPVVHFLAKLKRELALPVPPAHPGREETFQKFVRASVSLKRKD